MNFKFMSFLKYDTVLTSSRIKKTKTYFPHECCRHRCQLLQSKQTCNFRVATQSIKLDDKIVTTGQVIRISITNSCVTNKYWNGNFKWNFDLISSRRIIISNSRWKIRIGPSKFGRRGARGVGRTLYSKLTFNVGNVGSFISIWRMLLIIDAWQSFVFLSVFSSFSEIC